MTMKLTLIRDTFGADATLGKLSINGAPFCDALEDTVRPAGVKVDGATAIPSGKYKVIIDMSTRFKRLMPHVLDVPGFEGIRIHSGNTDKDTDGCVLVGHRTNDSGSGSGADWIGQSRDTFTALFVMMTAAISRKEEITLTITGEPE